MVHEVTKEKTTVTPRQEKNGNNSLYQRKKDNDLYFQVKSNPNTAYYGFAEVSGF
jgi:hypothetical protein